MIHFIESLRVSRALWSRESDLEATLILFDGDVVQAIQAVKESYARPTATLDLKISLDKLLSSLEEFRAYYDDIDTGLLYYPFSRSEAQVKDVINYLYYDKMHVAIPFIHPRDFIYVDLSRQSRLETFQVGDHRFPRLLNGLWQLASPSWGSGSAENQKIALAQLVKEGFVAADMADHYVRNSYLQAWHR